MRSISSQSAEERLKGVLDYFKNLQSKPKRSRYLVHFSRGQLAAMTGQRLETMIRIVKKMEERKLLISHPIKCHNNLPVKLLLCNSLCFCRSFCLI